MSRRLLEKWTLPPKDRITLNQKLGGALYDLIDQIQIPQTNGRKRELLWCIRYESGMHPKTLQRIFKGENDSIREIQRVECATREWVDKKTYSHILETLREIRDAFYNEYGETFLEEERISHTPKKSQSKNL